MKQAMKRSGVILLLVSLLAWSGPAAVPAEDIVYTPVPFEYNAPTWYAPYTGDVVLGYIPFSIPAGNNIWNSNDGAGGTRSITIPVGIENVDEVHTLFNMSWGDWGQQLTSVDFYWSDGSMERQWLTDGVDIRDHYHGGYPNSISPPTINIWDSGGYCVDKQFFDFSAPQYDNLTLDQIVITDNGAPGWHRSFLYGLTVGAEPEPADIYSFRFDYADGQGDYYTGSFYANSDQGYDSDWTKAATDENGNPGLYTISGIQEGAGDITKAGQVFVDTYYDRESGNTYYADPVEGQRPLVAGAPAGTDYLGRESGHISQAGVSLFFFGMESGEEPVFREADLGITYSFTYNYGGGEYVTEQLSEQSFYDIQVNAAGWAVCRGYDGDNEIYLYTGSGDPIRITDNAYEDAFPQINDLGQAVWYGYDPDTGQNQIYLYTYDADGGTLQKISNNTYGANAPQINNAGQVVWTGYDIDVYDDDIFLYTPGQDLQKLTDNTTYYDWNPQLNDAGQVAWQGLVNYDRFQIFLYTPGGEGNQQLSQTFEAFNPQINNTGQVVWYGYDPAGTNYEIFLYTPGEETPNQLTSNTYYDLYPQINDAGQVVWSMYEDPRWSDSEVFMYTPGGGSSQLTDNGYNDNTPRINNAGQVVWWQQGANGSGIYLYTGSGDPITISEGLTNFWGSVINDNGVVFWICDSGMYQAAPQPSDYYTGTVYASPDYGYSPGWRSEPVTDENGNQGYYVITGQTGYVDDAGPSGQFGQVFVSSYYDQEYENFHIPLKYAQAVPAAAGTEYLGSESDYIIQEGPVSLLFGNNPGNFYEADVTALYNFEFNYTGEGGGDSYQGFFYGHEYYAGDGDQLTWEGLPGVYTITSKEYLDLEEGQILGQVYVSSYYDHESDRSVTPLTYGQELAQPAGDEYLGSEADYIIQTGIDPFRFGNYGELGFMEADLGIAYSFTYNYGGGEYASQLISDMDIETGEGGDPQVNAAGQVVWASNQGEGQKIFLFNGSGDPIPLSDDGYDAYDPRINAAGQVVWSGYDGQDSEIFLYTGSGEPIQLTNNSNDDYAPQINAAGQVVWQGSDGDMEIFLYQPGEGTLQLTDNSYSDYSPQINAAGQVVWYGREGDDWEIFLYDGVNGPINISNNSYGDYSPQINAAGQVVWLGDYNYYANNDSEIYLYDGGAPIRLTNNSYDESSPQINAAGQMVWAAYQGGNWEIFLSNGSGEPIQLTENSYQGNHPQINAAGQVVWEGYDGQDWEIFLYNGDGDPIRITDNGYDDRYPQISDAGLIVWGSGEGIFQAASQPTDHYSGTVLASPDSEYYEGWRSEPVTDENGNQGYYVITGQTGFVDDADQFGQVFVSSYYDQEYGNSYTPMQYAQETPAAAGAEYLGSESDYIIQTGIDPFRFGNWGEAGFLEADVLISFDFTFTYFGSGDTYAGVVYAPPALGDAGAPPIPPAAGFYGVDGEAGYYVGSTWDTALGTYLITAMNFLDSAEGYVEGLVWVNQYNDAESGLSFAPVGSDDPLGTDYLGSESGYIISEEVPQYFFDGDLQEADLVTGRVNTFRFTYVNGDYYTGTVRSDPAANRYYLGYTQEVEDENGQTGVYEITGTALGVAKDSKKYGQVLVDSYFDTESGSTYAPKKVVGNDYLGSEGGYIVKNNVDYLRFGAYDGNHWEADVAGLYAFAFYYGNGDYYLGTVTAMAGTYQVGARIYQDDETTPQTGQQGYYHITGATYPGYTKALEEVAVKNYYDQESTKLYRVVGDPGTDGLRSEFYWIIPNLINPKKIDSHYFGGGFYEADVKQGK